MGFRFRKRINILPGVNINISKSGLSTSLGGKGATINISKKGIKGTAGIPGTGISYSSKLKNGGESYNDNDYQNNDEDKSGTTLALIMILATAVFIIFVAHEVLKLISWLFY